MSSSQYAYQQRLKVAGKCIRCGQVRARSPYSTFCIPCARRVRKAAREKRGFNIWRKGRVGRPPLTG